MSTAFSFILIPSTSGIVASGNGPAVTEMGYYDDLFIQLNCSAVPTGGTPTLDVYLVHSADLGTTWQDIAHFQFTTSAIKRFIAIGAKVTGGTTTIAASFHALAGDAVVQGPWGDRLRLDYVFAAGGSSGGYTLAAQGIAKPNQI